MPAIIRPYRGVHPDIAKDVFVADTATVIGDVKIGPRSSVWYGVTIRGDIEEIRIGAGTNIQDGTVIHVQDGVQGTYIGDDVTIGHMAMLHACNLQDRCLVGMKSCVLDGAVVETGAMVAAGALVTPGKIVRKGELWSGVPAKKLRDLSQEEIDYFDISAEEYVKFAADHNSSQKAS
ncbi:MAG: gamma carbonic anhydrase family protein [Alphaproteobacteria bacterium]|nr:gamma carbonic anhydrase family protein [Alphaproteobacteria bacterium]